MRNCKPIAAHITVDIGALPKGIKCTGFIIRVIAYWRLFNARSHATNSKTCSFVDDQNNRTLIYHILWRVQWREDIRLIEIALELRDNRYWPNNRHWLTTGRWAQPNWDEEDRVVDELVCVAIVGIEDPLRPEVQSVQLNGCNWST